MIRRLLLLNGVATIGLILFHAAGWSFTAVIFWADRYGAVPADQIGTPYYYFLRLVEQVIVFTIPAFLFVSGFFIAFASGRTQKTISWKMVGSRIRDLIIPYTIWTLVYWVLFFFEAQFLDGRTFSLADYLLMYLSGSTDPAYYYVILLIQFYLLSPFLVRWAKAHPVSLLVVTGIIQLAVQLQYFPTFFGIHSPYLDVIPKWLFVARIFWFSLGVVVGFQVKPVQNWLVRYKKGLALTALALVPLGVVEFEIIQSLSGQLWLQQRETLLDSLYSLAVIFAFLGYYQAKLPYASVLDDLGSKSFGIYLVHTIAMTYTARLIAVKLPVLLAYQLLFFLLMIVVGLGVPLVLMAMVNRLPIRPYYKYIFG
jgi:fucose 4-O-acetylase-like acetyltransferase